MPLLLVIRSCCSPESRDSHTHAYSGTNTILVFIHSHSGGIHIREVCGKSAFHEAHSDAICLSEGKCRDISKSG